MKKFLRRKSYPEPARERPDITELIMKMSQQLSSIERKMDAMTSRPQERSFERPQARSFNGPQARSFERPQTPKPFQRFDLSNRHGEAKQDKERRDRVLYKAVCADCNKECEVPFKPSQDRPVYCKECFSSRKTGVTFKPSFDAKPEEPAGVKKEPVAKEESSPKRKYTVKKKPVFKKRKK